MRSHIEPGPPGRASPRRTGAGPAATSHPRAALDLTAQEKWCKKGKAALAVSQTIQDEHRPTNKSLRSLNAKE